VEAAASAAKTQSLWHTSVRVSHRCVLQAPNAVMQNARDVVRQLDMLLRHATARCEAAAVLSSGLGAAASATAPQPRTTPGVDVAEHHVTEYAGLVTALVTHDMTGSLPHHHSALALAAISAGPGSDLQQQLFSLLCTMVKLGSTPVANTLPEDAGKGAHQARAWLRDGAALTAAALLADAACGHLHNPHEGVTLMPQFPCCLVYSSWAAAVCGGCMTCSCVLSRLRDHRH
jgi:hypothetical protein